MNKITRPAILTLITAAAVLVPIAGYSLAQNFKANTVPAAEQVAVSQSVDTTTTSMIGETASQSQPWNDQERENPKATASQQATASYEDDHEDEDD